MSSAAALTLPTEKYEWAVDALVDARQSGVLINGLADAITTDEAFAIQEAVRVRLGERIGGWKCALPRDRRIIAAPIFASLIQNAPGPVITRAPYIRYEPELAFTLVRDLPRGANRDDVVAAIGETRIALELLHGRYADVSVLSNEEVLADNLYNEGLLLGPAVPLDTVIDTISIDARTRPVNHPSPDILAPLVWLANHGPHPLLAGQTIITGSYIKPEILNLDATIEIGFGTAGTLTATFKFEGTPL
jgi:2-keto-4-pentenoate hydratase